MSRILQTVVALSNWALIIWYLTIWFELSSGDFEVSSGEPHAAGFPIELFLSEIQWAVLFNWAQALNWAQVNWALWNFSSGESHAAAGSGCALQLSSSPTQLPLLNTTQELTTNQWTIVGRDETQSCRLFWKSTLFESSVGSMASKDSKILRTLGNEIYFRVITRYTNQTFAADVKCIGKIMALMCYPNLIHSCFLNLQTTVYW